MGPPGVEMRHSGLSYPAVFGGVEREPHTRREIEAVVRRVSREERTGADAEIVQPASDGSAKARGRTCIEPVSNLLEVPTGNNQQPVGRELRLAQVVQLL